MRENQFGFEYSWNDLQPVRALAVSVFAAQLVGALCGLLIAHFPAWFDNLWAGGAIATLPGYAIGLLIQRSLKPGSLTENLVLVRRMGLVAGCLTVAGILFPPLASAHAG
jgi:hypothetical protein